MKGSATFSDCLRFRYELTREWDAALPWCCFIGLNPSTADATLDDPTIRRCIRFAQSFGCGNLLMLNLYAYRTPSPRALFAARKRCVDIIGGTENHFASMQKRISERSAQVVVAAWGRHGKGRGREALLHMDGLSYLAMNADGSPKHPLYLKADLKPTLFQREI
jgi:hypothetical protein